MSDQPQYISINPDTFVQGGLIDDVDAVLTQVRFCKFNYEGKSDEVLALKVNFSTPDGEAHEQYYSAGDLKRFQPTDDGKHIVSVGGATGLVTSSNASQFIISIANAGFPKNKMSGDVSVFDGTGVHLRRIAQAERKGLKQKESDEKREKTILVVEKLLWQPGEKPTFTVGAGTSTSKGAPTGAGKSVGAPPSTSAPAASGGNVDEKATTYVLQVLAENGGSFNKATLPNALFKLLAAAQDPEQSKVLNTAFKPEWLGAAERPWKLDAGSGVISL